MVPYVVQYLSSSIQTIDARTIIFSIFIWSTSFWSKLQELLDAFLIFWADVTFIHPTSIHLSNNSVILRKLFDAWKSYFFIIGVALSHSRRLSFMVDSYVGVNSILFNLTKFWQYFALISKYTTWIYHKNISRPELSKRTIQDWIQWLMQIIHKNHRIQS